MKIVHLLLVLIFVTPSYGLEVTLNTQLDKKLKKISKRQTKRSNNFKFNILRNIEIKGLKTISEEVVRNELSVFQGDKLDPFVITAN